MSTLKIEEMSPQELSNNALFLRAFLECSNELQEGVRAMLRIVFDAEADEQERWMATGTVLEILFPAAHEGLDLGELGPSAKGRFDGLAAALQEVERQEEEFARRLKMVMAAKGINQSELAALCGVGQPAISNMLNRQCRPQQRTIERLATALGVQPRDLWPEADVSRH